MNFKEWLILTEKIMIKDQEFRDPLLALQQIQKTHPNPENLAVTFTRIDKVGLNPVNKYETPLGIYLYPIDYVIEKQMDVPFAGEEPHINVCEFTRPEKILHMTSGISNQKGMELLNVFPKEQLNKASESADKYHLRSNYSKLWLVTRILANNKPTQWNINFRKCGIDGFMDHGTGTIHPSEPTQCVVFAANNLKLLHSIDNPAFNKTTDKFGVNTYKTKTFNYDGNKMSDEQIIGLLQSRRTLDVKKLLLSATDKDKIAELIIEKKPYLDNGIVYLFFNDVKNKERIAELLGTDKINKLPNDFVFRLLQNARDKDEMAKALGLYNIKKIDDDVNSLLDILNDKEKMKKMLEKYKEKKIKSQM